MSQDPAIKSPLASQCTQCSQDVIVRAPSLVLQSSMSIPPVRSLVTKSEGAADLAVGQNHGLKPQQSLPNEESHQEGERKAVLCKLSKGSLVHCEFQVSNTLRPLLQYPLHHLHILLCLSFLLHEMTTQLLHRLTSDREVCETKSEYQR